MSAVLLSASFPSGERGEAVAPYFPADIASAAAAVAEGTLRAGANLVFGGHPTISPIVLQISAMLNAGHLVTIYQSEEFRGRITDEVYRLAEVEGANLRFTPQGDSLEASIDTMRRAMLSLDIRAAFFVGGMSGIADEFSLCGELQPAARLFLFEDPGGMAAGLVQSMPENVEPGGLVGEMSSVGSNTWVLGGRAYASLVLRALQASDLGRPEDNEREL